jgi:hypothetical protein
MKVYEVPKEAYLQNMCFFFHHRAKPSPPSPPPPPPPQQVITKTKVVEVPVEKVVEKIVYVYLERIYVPDFGEILVQYDDSYDKKNG